MVGYFKFQNFAIILANEKRAENHLYRRADGQRENRLGVVFS
jgi:hypothetical protein